MFVLAAIFAVGRVLHQEGYRKSYGVKGHVPGMMMSGLTVVFTSSLALVVGVAAIVF